MHKDLMILTEWAVWANLDKVKNIELLLLKGHLFLEVVMNAALAENHLKDHLDYSFYRKVASLKLVHTGNEQQVKQLVAHLYEINELRNKLAHEFQFDVTDGSLEKWSMQVLQSFEGKKFTNYTYRTKIVHAFSVLTKTILENYSDRVTTIK